MYSPVDWMNKCTKLEPKLLKNSFYICRQFGAELESTGKSVEYVSMPQQDCSLR